MSPKSRGKSAKPERLVATRTTVHGLPWLSPEDGYWGPRNSEVAPEGDAVFVMEQETSSTTLNSDSPQNSTPHENESTASPLHIRVSTAVMANASRPLAGLTEGISNFQTPGDGAGDDAGAPIGTKYITLKHDDPEAMHTLCKIIHLRVDLLPRVLSIEHLYELASLADKYLCLMAVIPYIKLWLNKLPPQDCSSETPRLFLAVELAYLLRDQELFRTMTAEFLFQCNHSISECLKDPAKTRTPARIWVQILERREELRISLYEAIFTNLGNLGLRYYDYLLEGRPHTSHCLDISLAVMMSTSSKELRKGTLKQAVRHLDLWRRKFLKRTAGSDTCCPDEPLENDDTLPKALEATAASIRSEVGKGLCFFCIYGWKHDTKDGFYHQNAMASSKEERDP